MSSKTSKLMNKKNIDMKRKLTKEEIEDIVSVIKPSIAIPKDIATGICEKLRKKCYLQLEHVEIYPSLIPELKENILKQYYKTLIQPGESVGVATAQSIGERQTQQTLNSVDWKEKVVIKINDKIKILPVGELIDKYMENNTDVLKLENEQEYLDISQTHMEIPTTNEDGYTSWKKVEAITRHPGEVIKVKTKSGRSVVASLGKSFLIMQNNKLTPIDGKDLKLGDKIPTVIKFPEINITYKNINFENRNWIESYLKNKYNLKNIHENRLIISDDETEEFLSMLFNILGIITYIRENEIEINPYIEEEDKRNDIFLDEVVSIENVQSTSKYLYDFTVEETRNFNLFNGLVQRDTFHTAGSAIKTVVTGVPRFSELLNATREPKAKSCQIFLKEKADSIATLREIASNMIRELKVKDIVKNYKIFSNKQRENWYDLFDSIYEKDYSNFTEGIAITFDKELTFEYQISLNMIAEKIESVYSDLVCVFSPNHLCRMDIYVDMNEIEIVDDMTEGECFQFHLREVSIPSINDIKICGISGIENIFFEKRDNGEWFIETEGSNFQEVLGLDIADKTKTISNDMWEIYGTLGIEAARNFLVEEFISVVSSDGTFVNDSHILLLVDVMTFNGIITSISRYGLKKENCGPMAKASFEESLENFLKAGIYGEKENTKGVSASIMLGKVPKVGTGLCDVLVDIKNLPGCVPVITDVKEK